MSPPEGLRGSSFTDGLSYSFQEMADEAAKAWNEILLW